MFTVMSPHTPGAAKKMVAKNIQLKELATSSWEGGGFSGMACRSTAFKCKNPLAVLINNWNSLKSSRICAQLSANEMNFASPESQSAWMQMALNQPAGTCQHSGMWNGSKAGRAKVRRHRRAGSLEQPGSCSGPSEPPSVPGWGGQARRQAPLTACRRHMPPERARTELAGLGTAWNGTVWSAPN